MLTIITISRVIKAISIYGTQEDNRRAPLLRARLSLIRGHPEEGGDGEQGEFNPPINQQVRRNGIRQGRRDPFP